MPAPVRVTLTTPARADLVERFNATRDAEARLRYQMVLLADADHWAAALPAAAVLRQIGSPFAPTVRRPAAPATDLADVA